MLLLPLPLLLLLLSSLIPSQDVFAPGCRCFPCSFDTVVAVNRRCRWLTDSDLHPSHLPGIRRAGYPFLEPGSRIRAFLPVRTHPWWRSPFATIHLRAYASQNLCPTRGWPPSRLPLASQDPTWSSRSGIDKACARPNRHYCSNTRVSIVSAKGTTPSRFTLGFSFAEDTGSTWCLFYPHVMTRVQAPDLPTGGP